jgi:hypothetical protein
VAKAWRRFSIPRFEALIDHVFVTANQSDLLRLHVGITVRAA